ncbi:hypothetical protein V8G54_030242 [Vigna mungo]|uniref:Uncharacterized protein n=1 Tax=Vigna mungo TaxID=3915 RepID=A0AAQ3MW06_VIGMU
MALRYRLNYVTSAGNKFKMSLGLPVAAVAKNLYIISMKEMKDCLDRTQREPKTDRNLQVKPVNHKTVTQCPTELLELILNLRFYASLLAFKGTTNALLGVLKLVLFLLKWKDSNVAAPMVETYKNNLFPRTPVRAAIGLIWERDELLDYQFS